VAGINIYTLQSSMRRAVRPSLESIMVMAKVLRYIQAASLPELEVTRLVT
jgi:hypothetical protein